MNTKALLGRNRWALGLLAVLCLIGSTGADVWAGECDPRILQVKTDVDYVTFQTPDPNWATRTRENLKLKLDGAVQKLQQGKNADAKQKLQDFKDAVVLMRDAAKKKISPQDASLLLDGLGSRNAYDDGVNGAIGCVCLLP